MSGDKMNTCGPWSLMWVLSFFWYFCSNVESQQDIADSASQSGSTINSMHTCFANVQGIDLSFTSV